VKNYNIRDGDVICIKAYTARNYAGKRFFNVCTDLIGYKAISSFDGNIYLFQPDKIDYIKIDDLWWHVYFINTDADDIAKYGENSFYIGPVALNENEYLNNLLYDQIDSY